MVGWILRNIVGMGWMVLIYLPFTGAHARCYGTWWGRGSWAECSGSMDLPTFYLRIVCCCGV